MNYYIFKSQSDTFMYLYNLSAGKLYWHNQLRINLLGCCSNPLHSVANLVKPDGLDCFVHNFASCHFHSHYRPWRTS